MDTDKIVQDLNRRFATPLPEFYKRHIIVWYDEDKEFDDKINEIELINARVIILSGDNSFEVKKLISMDDTTSNILLYNPITYDQPDENWLLDVELYSEEFRADLISMWMDEIGIPSSPALRKQVKHYKKYFNAKARREKIAILSKVPTVPAQLHMAVMASLCGIKDIQPNLIIYEVLCAGLNIEDNSIYKEFVNYEADNAFWGMVAQGTGYNDEKNLMRFATHVLLTASTRTMRLEYLAGLDGFISTPHQAYCYDFISDWMHSEDSHYLYEIGRIIEEELKLPQRFMKLKVDDLVDTEMFPSINEVILRKLMTEISDHIIDVESISATVEKRRTCVWYDEVKNFYEGILQVANMQAFYKKHSAGFHTAEPKKVWKEYTEEYFKMDTDYRLYHLSFAKSLMVPYPLLDDLFKKVTEKVEGLYKNWFLGELGNNWSDVVAEDLEKYGYVMEVPKQTDFYKSKVAGNDNRVVVIISDALRYEVAVTLAEQLKREKRAKVDVKNCQSIFPTVTKYGMAALLPHQDLSVEYKNNSIAVKADDKPTDAGYRDGVLKRANAASIALQYKSLLTKTSSELSEIAKNTDVVYVYHDRIDDMGHTDEMRIFPACEDAISELKNMVGIAVNYFNATRIYITADHGFLYTFSPLTEDNKVDKTTESSEDVEVDRRYLITQAGAKPKYLLPVKFFDENAGYDAFAPRENIRIKKSGSGLNYVHGGISLQEMVVPVIEYQNLRADSKEYKRNKDKYDTKPVEVNLLSATHKISNMIFSLNFYQKEAVADNREAAVYQVYFTDSNGKTISDVQRIIADKTSDNGQDRTFRCSFNLKSLKYKNTETYYLVIADENGMQVSREEFQIDIAFAVDEFDFFS